MKHILTNSYPFTTTAVLLCIPLLLFGFALTVHAQGLIPCGGSGQPACNFTYLIQLIQNVIDFLLVDVAIPLAIILFAYAGWLYMSAGGDSGKVSKAHGIFMNVVFGLVLALAAWLIVNTIASALLNKNVFKDYFFLQ